MECTCVHSVVGAQQIIDDDDDDDDDDDVDLFRRRHHIQVACMFIQSVRGKRNCRRIL